MALLSSTLCAPLIFSKNPKLVSISSLHSRISLSHCSLRVPSLRFISAAGNGTLAETEAVDGVDENLEGLKRSLVDTVYGTELGFRARSKVRAEVSEFVVQLEGANPTRAPVEEPDLLNGNWVLLYASSDLYLPLTKLEISQTIDTDSFTIVNSTIFSIPFTSISFSVSASFEVQGPTRIQVTFKEGSLQPPEISMNFFGQQLSPGTRLPSLSLGPIEDEVAYISRVISGQSPLKIPIPGERTSTWLITTYLDKDLRISRGDGGFYVLAREGSPLLDQ